MDVAARLDELDHLLELLVGDVDRLAKDIRPDTVEDPDDPAQMAIRRSYVRAVFAAVEAMVEQHSRLLQELDAVGLVRLSVGVSAVLAPETPKVDNNGGIHLRPNRLPLVQKIRVVYREAPLAFGGDALVGFDGAGWRDFQNALKTRHSLAHPKSSTECYVYDDQINQVRAAEYWYQSLHNDYIRMAKEHLGRLRTRAST